MTPKDIESMSEDVLIGTVEMCAVLWASMWRAMFGGIA